MNFSQSSGVQPLHSKKEFNYLLERCRRCLHLYVGDISRLPFQEALIQIQNSEDKLCNSCLLAEQRGYHVYKCDGCNSKVKGTFKEVKSIINVFGKAFCHECNVGFFGSYNPNNPALNAVLGSIADKRKPRKVSVRNYKKEAELQVQANAYKKLVRRISKANYKSSMSLLNPKNHSFGPSGKKNSYHLDHIVPVTICWEYYVPAEDAASIQNLQIIPWFVNLSRGNYFRFGRMIGWPVRMRKRRSR
ncbi:MAG: hypothetical protein ACKOW3_07065 [Hyphomicrobium sp.]